MKSRTLSDTKRKKILDLIVQHGYAGKIQAIQKEWIQLYRDIYNEMFDDKTKELIKTLGSKWVGEDDSVPLVLGNWHIQLHVFGKPSFKNPIGTFNTRVSVGSKDYVIAYTFGGQFHDRDARDKNYLLPGNFRNVKGRVRVENAELIARFDSLETRTRHLIRDHQEAKRAAQQVLSSHRTTNMLIQAWPEIEKFVKEAYDELEQDNKLPAVVQNLNEAFDLPPEELENA